MNLPANAPVQQPGSLLRLAALTLLVGASAGLVCALFRLALERADQLREEFITWAHDYSFVGFILVVVACSLATVIAAALVHRLAPYASGSGIPHVEVVLEGKQPPARYRLIPVKFVGGLLAIGSGLALGREGPSVQMGATLAHLVGRMFRCPWPDLRELMAAGAGAGLATAFNAPIAGAIFVLEELVRKFETRMAIAALGASGTAIAVAHLFLSDRPDFLVKEYPYASSSSGILFLILGIGAGLLAMVYNQTVLRTIIAVDGLKRWPVEARAGLIGAIVGVVAWFVPDMVGGGEAITQRMLAGNALLTLLPLMFLLRFALGAGSYAARTPGGLFAPMLVLGAQFGLYFGMICRLILPDLDLHPEMFAVVGMAAFFTGVVRAPLTGIVLIIEMTGSFTLLLPLLGACFTAMLVTTLLGNPPIYASLRELSFPTTPEQKSLDTHDAQDASH